MAGASRISALDLFQRSYGWVAALDIARVRQHGVTRYLAEHVLSAGERQRVAIARVLAVDAELAVLDEPPSKLDEAGATRVAGLLRELAEQGRAVVCATHDAAVAEVD